MLQIVLSLITCLITPRQFSFQPRLRLIVINEQRARSHLAPDKLVIMVLCQEKFHEIYHITKYNTPEPSLILHVPDQLIQRTCNFEQFKFFGLLKP